MCVYICACLCVYVSTNKKIWSIVQYSSTSILFRYVTWMIRFHLNTPTHIFHRSSIPFLFCNKSINILLEHAHIIFS